MSTISTENLLPQSPYLNLKAAGSDGADGSVAGIHLRWDLLGALGKQHIPKGNLAASDSPYYTTAGFNKPDDYVRIYRTLYNRNFPIIINFSTTHPSEVIDEPTQKVWKFNNIAPIASIPSNTCNVLVRFPNGLKYDKVKVDYDPFTDTLGFLQHFDQIIEIEVENRPMFAAYIFMQAIDDEKPNITRIESISSTIDGEDTGFVVSCKRKYEVENGYLLKEDIDFLLQENEGKLELDDLGSGTRKVMAENINYIRLLGSNSYPTILWLETYEDFILGKNQSSAWEDVTQLSLTLDEAEVFNRLENTEEYVIDNLWPRFNGVDKVKVDNYKQKWFDRLDENQDTITGIKSGVQKYLELSMLSTNLEAINSKNASPDLETYYDDANPEVADLPVEGEFQFSYLTMLNAVSLDYHVARMLGYGYIDPNVGSGRNNQYVYIAVYDTIASIDGGEPNQTHAYMTLPVSQKDYRLPVVPELDSLTYGMYVSNGDGDTPTLMTDEQGYSHYDKSRAINLNLNLINKLQPLGAFFTPDEEFSLIDNFPSVMYGVRYRRIENDEWQKPDIYNDPNFLDYNNQPEVIPIIGKEDNPIFTHIEKEAGAHVYAVYGMNCFSRSTALSEPKATDITVFHTINTLMPPLNFAVQLIQEEEVLMFTTDAEQKKLADLTGDKTLVRLTFDWNNVHAANYWYGKEAEFFFRNESVNFVRGKIKTVSKIDDKTYEIRTTSYDIDSLNPPETVSPSIIIGAEANYINSLFSVDDNQYLVLSVIQSSVTGEGPIFTIEVPTDTATVDPDHDNYLVAIDNTVIPQVGSIFAVAENTSQPNSWPTKLNKKVALTKFSDYEETVEFQDGSTTILKVGGVYSAATIEEYPDRGVIGVDTNGKDIEGDIPDSITGIFKITFNTYVLDPHEDYPNVEWYQGVVRILMADGEFRELRVVKIDKKGPTEPTLVLHVVDSTFEVKEGTYEPTDNYTPIITGDNINVNFHPGYRVYLTAELDNGFNETTIYPATGTGTKYSFMACRSVDADNSVVSYLSTPAILMAREIIVPLPPENPKGPAYATRPDFYGKATYTFDTKMNKDLTRDPYILIFYRATEQIILDTLYKTDTVKEIREALATIVDDSHFSDRWNGLVNLDLDETGMFVEYGGYCFPNPDSITYRIPDPNIKHDVINPFKDSTKVPGDTSIVAGTKDIFGRDLEFNEVVKLAIDGAFLSLTEQPVLYQYIKSNCYETSNRKPVLRDSQGQLLIPGAEGYDPAPMAVKFTKTEDGVEKKIVRFTDYTLDGASKSIFFYYAIEMNDMLVMSERSEILGPIQLVNTSPPKAPELKKFYARTENSITGDAPAVVFEINDYLDSDGITEIQIYRAFTAVEALTTRTMKLAATINITDQIIDDFSDLDYYPFGDPLFYRLVAIRRVKNEFDDPLHIPYEPSLEDVPSLPSQMVLANIIDVVNPLAPEITPHVTISEDETTYTNVTLEWDNSVHNGIYYLYQMNSSGNWTKIFDVNANTLADNKVEYDFPDDFPRLDEDGNQIFYRFKVTVENSSGLLNIEENILTI